MYSMYIVVLKVSVSTDIQNELCTIRYGPKNQNKTSQRQEHVLYYFFPHHHAIIFILYRSQSQSTPTTVYVL